MRSMREHQVQHCDVIAHISKMSFVDVVASVHMFVTTPIPMQIFVCVSRSELSNVKCREESGDKIQKEKSSVRSCVAVCVIREA